MECWREPNSRVGKNALGLSVLQRYVAEGVLPKTCKSRGGGLSYLVKELSEVLQLPHKLTSVNLFVSKSALSIVMKNGNSAGERAG